MEAIIISIVFLGIPIGTFINNVTKKDKKAIIVNILMLLIYFICEFYIMNMIKNYNFDKIELMKLLLEWFYRILLIISALRALYLVINKKEEKSLLFYILFVLFCIFILHIVTHFAGTVIYPDEQQQKDYLRDRYLGYEIEKILLRDIYVINFFIRVWFNNKTNKIIEEKEKEESKV